METPARTVPTVVLIVGLGAAAVLWRCPSAERGIAMPSSNAAPTASASQDELVRPDGVGAVREPVGEDEGEVAESAPWFVRGRVVDQLSRPVPAAMIWVVAEEDPFDRGPSMRLNDYRGRVFSTDDEGRFDIGLAGPDSVRVGPARLMHDKLWVRADSRAQDVWVDPPADGIELRVRTYPFGTLVVRTVDRSRDEEVQEFRALVEGSIVHLSTLAERGELRVELPVNGPASERYRVKLIEPEVYTGVLQELLGMIELAEPVEISEEVVLVAGETREVRLEIP